MAMKKKFLGLAMAAAIALPASSAYAANNDTTLIFDDTDSRNHQVKVTGSITKDDGAAPAGKIQVELPTAMTFSVNENGKFTGCDFQVTNKSQVGIDVLVSQFRNVDNGITLHPTSGFTASQYDRSNVCLKLNGTVGGTPETVDLAGFTNGNKEEKILNVPASKTGLITLTGEAGTNQAVKNGNDVDSKGTSGEFTLIFKIQKDTKE